MKVKFVQNNKLLTTIIIIGGILRLSFLLYGAELFFNRENAFIDGDTWAWQNCIENLIANGNFTVGGDNGQFSRMPGYPFFIGIFYLLSNQNWEIAVVLIIWFQTFLDIFCIYIFYKLSLLIFNKKSALISAFLYATYPFMIVWNPVVYAEQLSISLMISGLYFFFKSLKDNSTNKTLIYSGVLLALAGLTRPQILPMLGILGLILIITYFKKRNKLIIKTLFFSLSFLIIYGWWPLRNYVNHDRIIFTKNADGFLNWQEDVISFMQFTYSVKAEWDPQYTSIIKNTNTTYPIIAYRNKEDSIKLERAIYLSKNCGAGFSNKGGYWKEPIYSNDCNEEVAKLFNDLRNNQIKHNPFNFYILVPLQNLKKAIFKFSLYDNKTTARKLASFLFIYRTLLILLGLCGIIYMIRSSLINESLIFLLLFIAIYFVLCFGTAPFMRNIEMRYFLPADILLLLPASYFLITNRITKRHLKF